MNYSVKVNGISVPVQTVTVSALPLNRLWGGVQRPLDQTEEAYVVSFDLNGNSVMEITAEEDFISYELRPKRYALSDSRVGNTVTLTIEKPMQFVFEADGRHHALHVFANPQSQVPAGDIIYYGKGEHKADLIWLESNQTLYIDEGAVVHGVIYAKDAENIRILGRGVLDSSLYRRGNDDNEGGREIINALYDKGFTPLDMKYYGNLVLNHCRNVHIEGIIFKDAPLWSVITRNECEDIVMDNIKLVGQWRYNADGIDICTSKNVTIKNSFIRAFDDCFVARGAYLEGETGNVENVTVENCVIWCDWGKSIEIWCGHKPTAIRNITVQNCYFVHLSASALNIATWYGSDNSIIEHVVFRNIYIDGDDTYDNLVVESADRLGYTPQSGFYPHLLRVSAERLGIMRGLGTQVCVPVDDFSPFKLRYRDILLDNIQYEDKRLHKTVHQLEDDILTIENIRAENCDFQIEVQTVRPQSV